jgi:hypothetical protein
MTRDNEVMLGRLTLVLLDLLLIPIFDFGGLEDIIKDKSRIGTVL